MIGAAEKERKAIITKFIFTLESREDIEILLFQFNIPASHLKPTERDNIKMFLCPCSLFRLKGESSCGNILNKTEIHEISY